MELFKEARKRILNSLSNYIKKSSNEEELSFVYYHYHDSREGGIETLSLVKYLKIIKKSKNSASYMAYLREAPQGLKVINFETLFSLDRLKDFCNKYILCDVSDENFLKTKPRGTQDIYPPRSLIHQNIQQIIIEVLHKNNYQPIIFPTFEYKEFFTSSLGSTTDIIHKEMYDFLDRKERELALRPEGTASTVRLVCQNKLIKEGYPLKLYYWANMFRYERPQQGRYREFWQLGVELINADGAIADYQILKLTADILRALGIKNFSFKLNYLGNNETKEKFKKKLKGFVEKTAPELCADCQRRYETNPLRTLDCLLCKNKYSYPFYKDAWSEKDNDYINELNRILDKFNFPYQYDYHLVRGLDYYTGLVFEIDLGTQKAILGGGRYDNLYREIGGVDVPALGFAIGIERLAEYLEEKKILKTEQKCFVGDQKCPLVVDYNLKVKTLKFLPKIIDYYQPKILIIVGEEELKSAGRGALAGPIIVAAVVLPTGYQNPLIQDSKILSPSQRKRAYRLVKKEALEYKIIAKSAREVEVKNPLAATKEAMVEALVGLKNRPDLCLVDGQEKIVSEGFKIVSVVGGDRRSINIAAASIIAKVTHQAINQRPNFFSDTELLLAYQDALLLKVLTESQAIFLAKTYQLEYQNVCQKLFQEPKNIFLSSTKHRTYLSHKQPLSSWKPTPSTGLGTQPVSPNPTHYQIHQRGRFG
ncbi:15878_t:CDS:2, partial [Racocetra fulgida]